MESLFPRRFPLHFRQHPSAFFCDFRRFCSGLCHLYGGFHCFCGSARRLYGSFIAFARLPRICGGGFHCFCGTFRRLYGGFRCFFGSARRFCGSFIAFAWLPRICGGDFRCFVVPFAAYTVASAAFPVALAAVATVSSLLRGSLAFAAVVSIAFANTELSAGDPPLFGRFLAALAERICFLRAFSAIFVAGAKNAALLYRLRPFQDYYNIPRVICQECFT